MRMGYIGILWGVQNGVNSTGQTLPTSEFGLPPRYLLRGWQDTADCRAPLEGIPYELIEGREEVFIVHHSYLLLGFC